MISLNTGKRIISGIEAINTNTGDVVAFIARSNNCFVVNEVQAEGHEPVYFSYCLYLAKKYIEINYLTKGNNNNSNAQINAAILLEAL